MTAATDDDGRYVLGLSSAGMYRQTLREAGQVELPGIPEEIDLRLGVKMRLITPGRYIVSATAQSVDAAGQPVTLVAAEQKEVVIAHRTTTDVAIDLSHTVTIDVPQRVVVADASDTLVLAWTNDNNPVSGRRILGGATLTGFPGATCAVPYEALSIGETRGTTSVDFKIQLSPGVYTLTLLDGRVLQVTAPGRTEIK